MEHTILTAPDQRVPTLWQPRRVAFAEAALWVSFGLGLLAAALIGLMLASTPGPGLVPMLVVCGLLLASTLVLVVWGMSYRRLVYRLGPSALEVDWLGETLVLPYETFEDVREGEGVGGVPSRIRVWMGMYVGEGRLRGHGWAAFYVTSRDPAHFTAIATRRGTVVLSAQDRQGFGAALRSHLPRDASESEPAEAHVLPATHAPWSALRDVWARWSLGVAGLATLLTFAQVMARFPDLPRPLALRFDGAGLPIEVGAPGDLFRLPLGGLVVLLANGILGTWLHPHEPILSRALWVSAAVVQVVLLVAVIRLTA